MTTWSSPPFAQRNAYKGSPQRPWVRVRLAAAAGGAAHEFQLLADTGSPCAVILGPQVMQRVQLGVGPDLSTNFGPLEGGWLRALMPELGLDQVLLGDSSATVLAAVQRTSPDFHGIAGLPFLRLVEYGGDRTHFWLRPASATP